MFTRNISQAISQELIEHLEKVFPDTTKGVESIDDLNRLKGRLEVVSYLRVKHEEQFKEKK